jgi:hypothetical protein
MEGSQTSKTFKSYIRSICRGPCLANTVHQSILEGSRSMDLDGERTRLWKALVDEMGDAAARKAVSKWIEKPRKL